VALPLAVARGARVLRRLLREQTLDLRGLDLPGFQSWLDRQLAHWRRDPVFVQRVRIRDLRRAHPELTLLEAEHRRAAAADAASPVGARLCRVEQELTNAGKAVAGLTAALKGAAADKRPALRQKLAAFQERQQALQVEQGALIRSSPERQTLLRLDAELGRLRAALGVDQEMARLQELQRRRGQGSGRSGSSFEQLARELTRSYILPDLLRGRRGDDASARLRVLHGVTLGGARTEFDQLVVRLPRRAGRPVEVLGMVEVKRNLNDLAHGFRRRQENLAWLIGDQIHYDPGLYRTHSFPSGHFDRDAVHEEDGEAFAFARDSFRRFRRDPATGLFLARLYFVTRAVTVWGVSAAALARISARVATDERWQPDDAAYLGKLLPWCQSLAEPLETPDVLRAYAASPRRARQVLVVGR
jgi:hypothetical protein